MIILLAERCPRKCWSTRYNLSNIPSHSLDAVSFRSGFDLCCAGLLRDSAVADDARLVHRHERGVLRHEPVAERDLGDRFLVTRAVGTVGKQSAQSGLKRGATASAYAARTSDLGSLGFGSDRKGLERESAAVSAESARTGVAGPSLANRPCASAEGF